MELVEVVGVDDGIGFRRVNEARQDEVAGLGTEIGRMNKVGNDRMGGARGRRSATITLRT